MKQIALLIEDLGKLAALDASRQRLSAKTLQFKNLTRETERIREHLPTAILKHYDLRLAKGKRGAARVHNGTCGGCHLSLPTGQVADMRREDVALQVCGYCSIFLLPELAKAHEGMTQSLPPAQIKSRRRKSKSATRPQS